MKKSTILLKIILILLVLSCGPAVEELESKRKTQILILENGSEYRGWLVHLDKDNVIFKTKKSEINIPRSEVSRILFSRNRQYSNITSATQIKDMDFVKAMKNQGTMKFGPEDNYVELLNKKTYTMIDNETIVLRTKKIIKVLNREGREQSTQFYYYRTDNDTQDLLYAVTITKDGKVIPVDEEAINDEPIYSSYPHYNRHNRVKFGFKNAEPGSIFFWEAEIRMKIDPLTRPFITRMTLCRDYPVIEKVIETRSVSKDSFVSSRYDGLVKHTSVSITRNKKGNFYVTTYKQKRAASRIEKEQNLLPEQVLYPSITVSVKSDFSSISKEFSAINNPESLPESIFRLTDSLVRDSETDMDKVTDIYYHINQKIKLAGVPLGTTGYKPTQPATLLTLPSLTVLDKTYLFCLMLQSLGINAQLLVYRPSLLPGEVLELQSIRSFNGIAATIELQNSTIKASFENSNYSFGDMPWDAEKASYLSLTDGDGTIGTFTATSEPYQNTRLEYSCKLRENGDLIVERITNWFGPHAASIRQRRLSTIDQRIKWIKSRMANLGADISDSSWQFTHDLDDFTNNVQLKEYFTVKRYAFVTGENSIVLKNPGLQFSARSVSRSSRSLPFYRGNTSSIDYFLKLEIPSNWTVSHLPDPPQNREEFYTISSNSTYNSSTNTVELQLKYAWTEDVINSTSYSRLKEILEERAEFTNSWILLEKGL
jgi:hypothetical protein